MHHGIVVAVPWNELKKDVNIIILLMTAITVINSYFLGMVSQPAKAVIVCVH